MSGLNLDQEKVEKIISLMDRQDKINNEIRSILSGGLFTKPKTKPIPENAIELNIDISKINWKKSNKLGGGPADPSDGWSWAFSKDLGGYVLPETRELVQACKQYGVIRIGNFEMSMGGREGDLLNRRKV